MSRRTAITVCRPQEEVRRLWQSSQHAPRFVTDATVTFKDAPGDRGTEIHLELPSKPPAGKIGESVQKLVGSDPLAKARDELRRFKALIETGEVPRSEGTPEGERVERKLKQRPAQPLEASELEKVGAP
jgi:uncharacterized membrane protein